MTKNKKLKAVVIDHWKKIRRDPLGCDRMGDGPYAEWCAFCVEYMDRPVMPLHCCMRCPIKIKTGQTGCINTPYAAARMAWRRLTYCSIPFSNRCATNSINAMVEWRQKSADELRFLRDLEVD